MCSLGAAIGQPIITDKLEVDDVDFSSRFDGTNWTVKWKWIDEEPALRNKVSQYNISAEAEEAFDAEMQLWIEEGILQPVGKDKVVDSCGAFAGGSTTASKVRPVLDFRQLNAFVSSHSGESAVCDETVRKWRMYGTNIAFLDLRKAYLQLHVDRALWKHQVVRYKGMYYFLTCLGFGLSSAPKIMSRILEIMLSLDEEVKKGTDHYIDDVMVNEDVVSATKVASHLSRFGLRTKPVEKLQGTKVLGLQINLDPCTQKLVWSRGNALSVVGSVTTRRELFSLCGQLVGHNPVAGWLRVACGFVKRNSEGVG